jgi:multiple sugar transport system substrate-binding protein
MYLMGQFLKDSTPEAMRDDMDFFRFPIINPDMPVYEETPIDGWMIPKNGKNRDAAVKWMKFIASDEIQSKISKELGRLAANKNVPAPDAHAQKGLDMILASDGVMGFYDRDTNPEMANIGMNGFVEFMMFPENLDDILDNLETERQRIFE